MNKTQKLNVLRESMHV